MATTTVTTSLGLSNMRGSSRQTRINPVRNSRNSRPNLRQNSLISNPASAQGAPAPDPHGFYPAITHFTDAITALPRDFRRHTSLLKEVDAKAWALEENLQKLLAQCLQERDTRSLVSTAQTIAGSTSSVAGDVAMTSVANSINGVVLDNASQDSTLVADPEYMKRRHLYAALRNNLVQMMMPMDEKNHVIHNANDELSRHIRRQDEIWPHVAEEISEETRMGSLKHWALTDLNPTKKSQAAAARSREAAASLAVLHDNDISERSERRREALLAKKQKVKDHADSDMDDRVGRKGLPASKIKRVGELVADNTNTAKVKGRKTEKIGAGGTGMERQGSKGGMGGTAMSRENSQQENVKKRKAPTSASTVARKRLNVNAQESPKLGSSPLAATFGKEAYKRSPALSAVRPALARGRQNSSQTIDGVRPSSSASRRNVNGLNLSTPEVNNIAAMTGKTPNEVRATMKETTNSKGDRYIEEDAPANAENTLRGGVLLERSGSKRSHLGRDTNLSDETLDRVSASPRLSLVMPADGKNGKTKASKTSTPTVSTFAEAEANESADGGSYENGHDGTGMKLKRPARPRLKDHHGLHDSLSPKGLPTKRTHKKNGSYSLSLQATSSRNNRDEEIINERKASTSTRTNSRSTKAMAADNKENRAASGTPRLNTNPNADLVDEPDSMTEDIPISRNRNNSAGIITSEIDVSGEGDIDGEEDVDEEMEDPNEERYCYCNGVSYGEMVACDNNECPKEWFHLECLGMKTFPTAKKWYCEICKPKFVK